MSLPPLATIPTSSIRLSIAPVEWEACLESWLTLTDLYLRSPQEAFSESMGAKDSRAEFLKSFYHELTHPESGDESLRGRTALKLKKSCFMLVHRVFIHTNTSTTLLEFDFLADFCRAHIKSSSLSRLMDQLWKQRSLEIQKSMQKTKISILKALDSYAETTSQDELLRLADLMLASPDAAALFMTGSDFLDALNSAYTKSNSPQQWKIVTAVAYLGLCSLAKAASPNVSLLTDHLYSLKTQADGSSNTRSLLTDLVTNTPLLSRLRRLVSGTSTERLFKLLDILETYRSASIAQLAKQKRRKPSKGRGKAAMANGEIHLHRMSLVTQIQDLFPDLGSGFVLKLLDEYEDDVEQVTAHLLDDSLPAHLKSADHSEQAAVFDTTEEAEIEQLAPRSTPPPQKFFPERRNVFDDDEFDRLEMDTAKLHIGKKNEPANSDQPNKAAILSALAAFDSDDDERDDTYDVEDVGGTVDTAHPDGEPGPSAKITQEENNMALFTAYKSSPELFGRTFDIRRGQTRQALKAETGMTDEAIEGWAIMLQRDPKRLKRLEAQFGTYDGKQSELARTAYRDSPGGTETEDSDAPAQRGGYRGRGRGRGRGGRGGNVAGPSNDADTAAAQRRKETSKGSRANHNRRDQRAKKMARGGFAG